MRIRWHEGAIGALALNRPNALVVAAVVAAVAISRGVLVPGIDGTRVPPGAPLPLAVEEEPGDLDPDLNGPPVALAPLLLANALDDYEREMIQWAIDNAHGNIAEAARRLQTDRPNLYRRMKRLGIGQTSEPASELTVPEETPR